MQSYKLMAEIHESRGNEGHDRFMIVAERWRSIAADANEHEHEGAAIEAVARGMCRKYHYRRALKQYEIALDHWSSIRDDVGKARAYRGMQHCLEALHEPFRAAEFGELARQREEAVKDQMRKVSRILKSYEEHLVGATLKMASTVMLERVSATMPWARDEQRRLRQAIVDVQVHQVKTLERMDLQEARLVRRSALSAHPCVLPYRFAPASRPRTPWTKSFARQRSARRSSSTRH